MDRLFSSSPKPRHWYPAIPCCPFCQRSSLPRSDHATGVCLECATKPGLTHRLEPVPASLGPKGYRLYLDKPFRWLALMCGKTHIRSLPQSIRAAEPHRVMHILLARFWGDEDVELTYDVLAALHPDVWSQVSDDGDEVDAPDESDEIRKRRERHSLHVRIWRSKFNNKVAKPLIAWLTSMGVPFGMTSIAREQKKTATVGWEVALVLDAIGVKRRPTLWSLVLSHPSNAKLSIVCTGAGCMYPSHITVLEDDAVATEAAYSGQLLYSVLNSAELV